jgi:hypothetical protein
MDGDWRQTKGRCVVDTAGGWIVTCAACGQAWKRVGTISEYERQAVESQPCPTCGGYTLGCREPQPMRNSPRPKVAARMPKAA